MENYTLEVDTQHGTVTVNIFRKAIKNIHLKVFSDLQVNLSVPKSVEDSYITEVLQSKKTWIVKQLEKYRQSQGYNTLLDIKSGTSTQYLGKDLRIIQKDLNDKENLRGFVEPIKHVERVEHIEQAEPIEHVELTEKSLYVYLKNTHGEKELSSLIHKFWRKQALTIFQREMDRLYLKIFKKYDIAKPELHVRKMKTLWGSCTQSKNKITLNEYLLKADLLCIQYVILHELTHLLYPYHNNAFYTFLTIHMPDWKERKKRLDKDVVQGL